MVFRSEDLIQWSSGVYNDAEHKAPLVSFLVNCCGI